MKRRKWNGLLALFSIAGGLAGFVLGEVLLSRYSGSLHETLLMGLYFGLLALTVTLGRLLAETISPRLNGANWRRGMRRTAGNGRFRRRSCCCLPPVRCFSGFTVSRSAGAERRRRITSFCWTPRKA
ncbi:hypothetical protein LJK88_20150 [Paenibacillus sp. P26]|nr:hypothetical protein LJK88_20150 [Paenibacillus sp. P26]